MAGAIQILHGKVPYRDFWYDKPPLAPYLYMLWGARTGVPLRVAGALFVFAAAWWAFRLGRRVWGEREGIWAACLLAFFLTFGIPGSVMALAPDLLLIVPHLAAITLLLEGKPFLAGIAGGVGLLVNPKAVLVLAVCGLWEWRSIPRLAAGAVLPNLALVALDMRAYWFQVWEWGSIYSANTFVANPIREGIARTASWAGFHAALVAGAVIYFLRGEERDRWRFAVWVAVSLAAVTAGWRFFPRYYFHLLPVAVLLGARGVATVKRPLLLLALLLIPLVRFGPRFVSLALGQSENWADTAMYRDSVAVSRAIRAAEGDTLLVWGYRPDIFGLTRLPAGTPFLDSQPLTGVIADRHLTRSEVATPELAASNRQRLTSTRPTWVVDGLGLFNPALAITNYPDLAAWLSQYEPVARTASSVVYRLKPTSSLKASRVLYTMGQ